MSGNQSYLLLVRSMNGSTVWSSQLNTNVHRNDQFKDEWLINKSDFNVFI